jgi:hypothetical protein
VSEIVDSIERMIVKGIVGINIEGSENLNPILVDEMEFCELKSAIRSLSRSL